MKSLANTFESDFIDEVKSRCDLVDIAGEQINLEKKGSNYVGLCPFHSEKTPSFSLSREKQLYHCFGCGASGDLFAFVMNTENITFPDAVRAMAAKAGLKIPEEKAENKEVDSAKEKYYQLHQSALRFYSYILQKRPEGRKALQYLKKRGITDSSIEFFGIGYAPAAWDSLYKKAIQKGYSPHDLIAAGLVGNSSDGNRFFDRFRDRIMFPIEDIRGRVIGFGGRIMVEKPREPKYLNSPATLIFDKRKVLYGIHAALANIRKEKRALVVEGYTDVILLHQEGFKNVVASMGTALNPLQARLLRAQAEEVVIAYDADVAGAAAAERGLFILKDTGCSVKVAAFPAGHDPDSFIREKGKKSFQELLENAEPLLQYRIRIIKEKYNLNQPEGKLLFVKEVMSVIHSVENVLERDEYLKKLAEETDISEKALRTELRKYGKAQTNKEPDTVDKSGGAEDDSELRQSEIHPAEKVILSLLFSYEGLYKTIIEKINDDIFSPDVAKIIDACRTLGKEGNNIKAEQLINCFNDRFLQQIIAELNFKSPWDGFSDDEVLKIVDDCVGNLNKKKIVFKRQKIEKKIKEAEKEGRKGDVVKLLLNEWERLKLAEQKLGHGFVKREG